MHTESPHTCSTRPAPVHVRPRDLAPPEGAACADPVVCARLHATSHGAVLFVVQRAYDGWLAFDLAGTTTDTIGGEFEVTRGGPRFTDRVFALHADLGEVRAGRALAIAGASDAFAFGGDLLALVRRARGESRPRLRLLRGATVLDGPRLRSGALRLGSGVLATHGLVFDTAPALLPLAMPRAAGAPELSALSDARAVAQRVAQPVAQPLADAPPARPTRRSDTPRDRAAARGSVPVRTR